MSYYCENVKMALSSIYLARGPRNAARYAPKSAQISHVVSLRRSLSYFQCEITRCARSSRPGHDIEIDEQGNNLANAADHLNPPVLSRLCAVPFLALEDVLGVLDHVTECL